MDASMQVLKIALKVLLVIPTMSAHPLQLQHSP